MALTNCPECQHQVSQDADACPNCGHPIKATRVKQAKRATSGCATVIVLAIFVAVGIYFVDGSGDSGADKPASASAAQADKAKIAACRADLQCWSAQGEDAAIASCKPAIEDKAAHEVKWKDDAPEGMFTRVAWDGQEHQAVRYIGDDAYFQNGFGAYDPVMYSCVFDPDSARVLKVEVMKGRLSQLGLPDS